MLRLYAPGVVLLGWAAVAALVTFTAVLAVLAVLSLLLGCGVAERESRRRRRRG